jgi:hypothetical protein
VTKLFVTYGYGSNLRDNYSIVEGADLATCYEQIRSVCGRAYAFAYFEKEFAGQAERYKLTEVPLQPQVKI